MKADPTSSRTLADVKPGEHIRFLCMQADKGTTSRLTSLGFTPGVDIEMIQNFGHGPLMVTLRGTRVALGRREAKNILVQKG